MAAQQFEFEPAEMDGKPIAVQITYRYRFRLKSQAAPPPPAPDGGPSPPDGGAPHADGAPLRPPPRRAQPVVNFAGVLRERGTRLPLAGVLVTVFRDDGDKPIGFEATTDDEGRLPVLRPGARASGRCWSSRPATTPTAPPRRSTPGERLDVVYYVERGVVQPVRRHRHRRRGRARR